MAASAPASTIYYRFGHFEFLGGPNRLLKHGTRLPLERKPALVLACLLQHRDRIVTREELQRLLWPDNTFVDFELGLRVAVNKARLVLADSADEPRYIETIIGTGYRWIADVDVRSSDAPRMPHQPLPVATLIPTGPGLHQSSRSLLDSRSAWILITAFLGCICLLGVFLALKWRTRPLRPASWFRTTVALSTDARLVAAGDYSGVALSPDGAIIAFSAVGNDNRLRIYIRHLDSLNVAALPGTDDGMFPFWSPDAKHLAFFTYRQLKRYDFDSSAAVVLATVDSGRGGAWSLDGRIVFSPNTRGPLYLLSASGGTPVPLTTLSTGETTHRWPVFLPDGRHFVYFAANHDTPSAPGSIHLASLDGRRSRIIATADSNPVIAGDRVMFVSGEKIVEQFLNVTTGELDPASTILAESVSYYRSVWYAPIAAAGNTVLYRPSDPSIGQLISRYTLSGRRVRDIGRPGPYYIVNLAPNGADVATACGDPDMNICIIRSDGTVVRVTDAPVSASPIWSPDSNSLAYYTNRGRSRYAIAMKSVNDSTPERILFQDDLPLGVEDWNAAGSALLIVRTTPDRQNQLSILNIATGTTTPVMSPQAVIPRARFSPDARWIAFDCEQGDTTAICVNSYPVPHHKYRLSAMAGSAPRWRGDGRGLFYLGPGHMLYEVRVDRMGSSLSFGIARPLFRLPVSPHPLDELQFDIARDGNSVIVNAIAAQPHSTFILLARGARQQ